MAAVDVLNIKGEKVSEIDIPDSIFNVAIKESVLHEVVTMQLASRRSGTACVKHRSDISGSTKKLYRQKGTGRARRGNIKSPLLRGGGSVFGPNPRSYAYKVPKKVRKLALKMALTSKYNDKKLLVLDQFELDEIKTKKFIGISKAINVSKGLFITEKENRNIELSARNIPNIKILRCEGLNVYDILKFEHLVLPIDSIKAIERRLL
ncbi:MAG: 50S ribosomal protein L4 [Desulfobacterales bacterium]|nr:50S ribosomal protein L4 [Desulfobacterales bacterium]MBF0396445.1 50S ribosomal protein L4 [Desulfobacterales bacterium]